MLTALIILADGAEEMEAIISADVLRRAAVKVTIAGLTGSEPVKCSREVVIVPDVSLSDVADNSFDVVILPGGMKGAVSLSQSAAVGKILKEHEKKGKLIAAICAAPIALKSHSIGVGKSLTSYPSVKAEIAGDQYTYSEERVVVDGQLITSRAPGTAFEFAIAIVEHLLGKEKAEPLFSSMLVKK